jgi:hypothetical protein
MSLTLTPLAVWFSMTGNAYESFRFLFFSSPICSHLAHFLLRVESHTSYRPHLRSLLPVYELFFVLLQPSPYRAVVFYPLFLFLRRLLKKRILPFLLNPLTKLQSSRPFPMRIWNLPKNLSLWFVDPLFCVVSCSHSFFSLRGFIGGQGREEDLKEGRQSSGLGQGLRQHSW